MKDLTWEDPWTIAILVEFALLLVICCSFVICKLKIDAAFKDEKVEENKIEGNDEQTQEDTERRKEYMSEVKGKWVLSTQYHEGKRFYINLEFVKGSSLKMYERRQDRKFRKLNGGEMRYEYFDDYAEVSKALYGMVCNFTIGRKE